MFSEKDVPPTYGLFKRGKTTIVCQDAYREVFMGMELTGPESLFSCFAEQSPRYQGRAVLRTVTIPSPVNERMIIRHYRRGGKMQKLTSDLYWGSSRPLRELKVAHLALEKGVPTAEIAAACHTRVFWLFHRGDLISKEIEKGMDLIAYLGSLPFPMNKEAVTQKWAIIQTLGKTIRRMHDAGIFHGDLHLKNIILQINHSREPKTYIIDFDKSKVFGKPGNGHRMQNLMRLRRSVDKYKKQGLPITRSDVLRFLRAYYERPATWNSLIRELSRRYQRHLQYHRFGESLLRWF